MSKDLSFLQQAQKETKDIRRYEGNFYQKYDLQNMDALSIEEIVNKIKPKNFCQKIALSNVLYTRNRVQISFFNEYWGQ